MLHDETFNSIWPSVKDTDNRELKKLRVFVISNVSNK